MTLVNRKTASSNGTRLFSRTGPACLVGVIFAFVMAPMVAQADEASATANSLRMQAQQLMTHARETASGRQQSFDALDKDVTEFDQLLGQGDLGPRANAVASQWQPVKTAAQTLLNAGPDIVAVSDVSRQVEGNIDSLQRELSTVVESLESDGASASSVAAAQKMLWLSERSTRNINKVLAGADGATGAANEIERDVAEFNRIADGLRQGNKVLGIEALTAPAARSALDKAVSQFSVVSQAVNQIVGVAPGMQGVVSARNTIAADTPLLTNTLAGLAIAGGEAPATTTGWDMKSMILAALAALLLVAVVLLFLALRRRISHASTGVDDVNTALLKVAEGDLTAEASDKNVVTREIARELNAATANQRELIRNIKVPFDIATDEITRIGKSALAQMTKSKELTRSVVDSTTATTDMVRSCDEIKKASAKAAQTSKRNRMQVARGYELTKDMSKASADVRESVQETSKSAKRQGELIQSVTTAAEYIQALNTKISVVAINTRIEAEKAGEHGRPFLGIAEAIGDLLWEAEEEGRKIISEVRMLQNLSAENLSSIETTVGTIVTILEYIDRLDASLEEINEGSNEISTIISSVDDAAGQSADSAQHLNGSMAAIRERNKEISDSCDQTQMRLSALQQSMRTVAESIGQFRIGDHVAVRSKGVEELGRAPATEAVYGEDEMQALEKGTRKGRVS